ncbi:hypothetical protein ACVOMV_23755 [Mesorhizobium atlanticum]
MKEAGRRRGRADRGGFTDLSADPARSGAWNPKRHRAFIAGAWMSRDAEMAPPAS